MEKGTAVQRFVQCGGWIRELHWRKPKSSVAWSFAALWLVVFGIVFSNDSELAMAFWKVGVFGQAGLVVTAMLVSALEKPVLRTRLVENPEKKPHAFY